MWARSSLLSALALVACGKKAPPAPTVDPAVVKALALKIHDQVPAPAAVRDCTPADYAGVPTMTWRTLEQIAGVKLADDPEHADWINPTALDAPAARTLATKPDPAAAAVLMSAPAWVIYHVDHVNAPMALGIKEPKTGTIGTRVIRFEKTGLPSCASVFFFQNDPATSDLAIEKSDQAVIDPEIAKALREDLAQQYIKLAPPRQAAGSAAK